MSEKYEPLSDEELADAQTDMADIKDHVYFSGKTVREHGLRFLATISARDAELKELRDAVREWCVDDLSCAPQWAEDDLDTTKSGTELRPKARRFLAAMKITPNQKG